MGENAQLKVVIGDEEQPESLRDKTISEIIGRNADETIVRHKTNQYFKDDSKQPSKFGRLGDILKVMSGE